MENEEPQIQVIPYVGLTAERRQLIRVRMEERLRQAEELTGMTVAERMEWAMQEARRAQTKKAP